MAEISPLTFFRFAAEHTALLVDLFYRSAGLTEAALRDLILRNQKGSAAVSSGRVMEQLKNLGIVESVPGETALFEMTRPISGLMSYLLRQHRLTSIEVIRAYLKDIERLTHELSDIITADSGQMAMRILLEISDVIERIRQDSRSNRDGIIGEVIRLKTNRERYTVRERFEIINRLWKRYLEPLRDLIDVKKAMDASLDRLQGLVDLGQTRFLHDRIMAREFKSVSARLLRLRRDVLEDYRESLAEISPLYESLRRECALSQGASLALQIIGQKGIRALRLTSRLAIPIWRTQGLLSNKTLIAYYQGVKGYTPGPRPKVSTTARATRAPRVITMEELKERLVNALPVDDLMEWLFHDFSRYPLHEILKAYGRILGFKDLEIRTLNKEKAYEAGHFLIRAYVKTVSQIQQDKRPKARRFKGPGVGQIQEDANPVRGPGP